MAGWCGNNRDYSSLPRCPIKRLGPLAGLLGLCWLWAQAAPSPPPVLASLRPSAIRIGKPFTFVFKGSGFQKGALLVVSGPSPSEGAPEFISSKELRLSATLGPGTPTGDYTIRVKNPDGRVSAARKLKVLPSTGQGSSPAPALTSVAPDSIGHGESVALVFKGSGFQMGAKLSFAGPASGGGRPISGEIPLIFISPAELKADIVSLSTGVPAGKYSLQVKNPDGQTSGTLPLRIVRLPPPSLTSVAPSTITLLEPFSLSFLGSGFRPGAAVQVSSPASSETPLTFVSPAELQASGTLGHDAPTGDFTVRIKNPDGQVSEARALRIEPLPAADAVARSDEHYLLGMMHYSSRNFAKAREEFKKALELYPGHSRARRALERLER